MDERVGGGDTGRSEERVTVRTKVSGSFKGGIGNTEGETSRDKLGQLGKIIRRRSWR